MYLLAAGRMMELADDEVRVVAATHLRQELPGGRGLDVEHPEGAPARDQVAGGTSSSGSKRSQSIGLAVGRRATSAMVSRSTASDRLPAGRS